MESTTKDNIHPIGVIHIEDNSSYQRTVEEALRNEGIPLLAVATTFNEAMCLAAYPPPNTRLALLDSNLTAGKDDGDEGDQIFKVLMAASNKIIVISHYGSFPIPGTHYSISKDQPMKAWLEIIKAVLATR